MKEWKGNSDSVRSRLAINKQHTTKGREADDFYATDPVALERLLDGGSSWLRGILDSCKGTYFSWQRPKYEIYKDNKPHTYICNDPDTGETYTDGYVLQPCIWECACGSGNLYKVLKERGYKAIYSDIKDRGFGNYKGMLNQDFLQNFDFARAYNVGVILTNPPYSLATEFIKHALDVLPENGIYCALMNISYLAGQRRFVEVYMSGTLREVYIFSKRVECWRNNDKEKYGKKAMVDFAWFVFQKGYFGQPTLYWL